MHHILPALVSSATRSVTLSNASSTAQVIRVGQAGQVMLAIAAPAGALATVRFGDATVADASAADIDLAAGVNIFRVDASVTNLKIFTPAGPFSITFWTYNA